MPGLRNLSGREVLDILTRLGFETIRMRGSHHHLRLDSEMGQCYVAVPVHRRKSLPPGTLKAIYRQAAKCVDEKIIRPLFYTD